jgi:hypothetical protein
LKFFQSPSLPLKVGIPLSADTPAPVKTTKFIIDLIFNHTPRVRNSEKLEKPSDKEPLVGRGL